MPKNVSLGDLERAIMDVLWEDEDGPGLTVREVSERLTDRDLAYTTVMTVLDRLAKKGLVARQLEGRAWLYEPARSRLDLYVTTVNEALEGLTDEERADVLRRVGEESAALAAAAGDA